MSVNLSFVQGSLLTFMVVIILPLTTTQPGFDWFGGPKIWDGLGFEHDQFSQPLGEITAKAAYQAAFYGSPVMYETRDGSIIVEAQPNLSKSPCEKVYEEVWDHGKLVMNTTKEFCEVSNPVPAT